MAERLHPGVYVEEVGGSVRPIQAVSTSTAAFLGEAGRGIPDRATLCTTLADFERAFGGPRPGQAGNLALAVRSFFDAGGQRVYVVRVLPADSTAGQSSTLNARFSGGAWPALKFYANGRGRWSQDLRIDLETATHFEDVAFRVVVRSVEGGSSTIVEVFDDVRMDPTHQDYVVDRINSESQYIEAEDLYGAAIEASAYAETPVPDSVPGLSTPTKDGTYTIYEDAELVFGLRDPGSGKTYSKRVSFVGASGVSFNAQGVATLNQAGLRAALKDALKDLDSMGAKVDGDFRVRKAVGTDFVIVEPRMATRGNITFDLGAANKCDGETLTLTIAGTAYDIVCDTAFSNAAALTPSDMAAGLTAALGPNNRVTIVGDTVVIDTEPDTAGTAPTVASAPDTNKLTSTAAAGEAGKYTVETLDGLELTVAEVPSRSFPKTLQQLGFPAIAQGYEQGNPANPEVRPANKDNVRLEGGSDGNAAIAPSDYSGTEEPATGLRALDRVPVNILALPGLNDADYISVGMAYADSRNDCFFLADGPGNFDGDAVMPDAARSFIQGLPTRSDNAAMYYPWVQIPDPAGVGRNPRRFVAPSGHMAGVYARTDVNRGVWKAPAGLEATISGSVGLQFDVLDRQQDLLNPVSLNCLRLFPGAGIVSWGARTLSSDPEWRYVPVRRTALFLKESLRRGLQWAVFEPNDDELWDRIKLNITGFMLGLYDQGAFQGATPDEAFSVACDRSTNPQYLVDQGIVTARVAFAPLKPAEFVVIQVSQKTLVSSN